MKSPKPITDKDIKEFVKQAKLLRDCKYLQSSIGSKVELNYKEGEGLKFEAKLPPREDIEIILMRIRPFIEYNERLHVGRIIIFITSKYGKSDFLKALQILQQPESELKYPSIMHNEKEYRILDLFYLYMYGKYFHLDEDKQEISLAFEQATGPLAEYFALSQIDKFVGIVLAIAAYIRNNKLIED